MSIAIPWWLWLLFGFFLGAISFSKNLRNQLLAMTSNKKKAVNDGKDNAKTKVVTDTSDGGRKGGNDTYTIENDRRHGTTITKIHIDD